LFLPIPQSGTREETQNHVEDAKNLVIPVNGTPLIFCIFATISIFLAILGKILISRLFFAVDHALKRLLQGPLHARAALHDRLRHVKIAPTGKTPLPFYRGRPL
jgi:hypothetical protein